jgi:ubiquinol-cytochrome c reductase cytochrome b subunit
VFIGRFFITHVFIIPIVLIALIGAHLANVWHQGHTQWAGVKQRETNEVGDPLFPVFMVKTGALFMFVFGITALLATVAQINPIWLYGPYDPVKDSASSQPDWYIGILIGALRIMPGVETNLWGHTIVWAVFLPAVALPAVFFFLAGLYPVFEEWATGDLRHHQILDRPRHAPGRTAFGVAVIVMGADLLLAGSDDLLSRWLMLSLYDLVWLFRIGFFVFPVAGFLITRHVCRAMQRSDRRKLRAGIADAIIPEDGAYAVVSRPVPAEQRIRMDGHRPEQLVAPIPRHLIPLPTPRRIRAQLRARLNRLYTSDRLETRYGTGQVDPEELTPPGRQDGSVWPPVPRRPASSSTQASRGTRRTRR